MSRTSLHSWREPHPMFLQTPGLSREQIPWPPRWEDGRTPGRPASRVHGQRWLFLTTLMCLCRKECFLWKVSVGTAGTSVPRLPSWGSRACPLYAPRVAQRTRKVSGWAGRGWVYWDDVNLKPSSRMCVRMMYNLEISRFASGNWDRVCTFRSLVFLFCAFVLF